MQRALLVGWLLLVLGGVGAGGCAVIDGGCPCGSDPSDPLSQHDLSFAGEHVVDEQCVCRCADAEPEAFPKDRDCADYETKCEDPQGNARTFVCN